eukprot:scaffold196294_cov33-Prasinocladus_malaysianus.AAC.1
MDMPYYEAFLSHHRQLGFDKVIALRSRPTSPLRLSLEFEERLSLEFEDFLELHDVSSSHLRLHPNK